MRTTNPRRRRALTLVELLIAIMITSMLAVGLAAMLHAAGYGTSSKREVRRLAVQSQQLRARMADAGRYARRILASGDLDDSSIVLGYLILKRGERELQLIGPTNGQTDPVTKQFVYDLTSYRAVMPEEWDDDQIDTATASILSAAAAIADSAAKGGRDFASMSWPKDVVATATLWSDRVSEFSVRRDKPAADDARVVSWELTLTDELLTEPVAGCASLRSVEEDE